MDKKLLKALNDHIKNEFYSAYLYLSMAAYFESTNLGGFAHWMTVQAKEEKEHAMKFFGFLTDRGERVALQVIPEPPADFSSPKQVFEQVLKHEKLVTSLINKLYTIAGAVADNATSVFLQWFITEQVEEEKNATVLLEQLKIIKPDSAAMLVLDRALAQRQ